MSTRIAVIGGGAAGMMAALHAAEHAEVTVFEKQDRLLRKVRASGNGQCNIANADPVRERYHGDPEFADAVIAAYPLARTREFFCAIGIPFVETTRGRLYPHCRQAAAVCSAIEIEAMQRGVRLELSRKIERIERNGSCFSVHSPGGTQGNYDRVILACGSLAHPSLGGSEYGYALARSLGHRVIDPLPSILPVNVPLKKLHRLEGIKWDVALRVMADDGCRAESEGELLFTKYGLSGPATLEISRAIHGGGNPVIVMDLFPSFAEDRLAEMLEGLLALPGRTAAQALEGILKKRMPEVFLELFGADPHEPLSRKKDRRSLAAYLKAIRVTPGPCRGFGEAVVAAGGVDTREVNPETMESRTVPGLYLAGELLNVDGDSGGFNLQFAWSSGALAGIRSSS
jgi:predicted Rossmann fold flavoprotein